MKNSTITIILSLLFVYTACVSPKLTNTTPKDSNSLYQQSITAAMSPDSAKIFGDLTVISKENKNLVWKTINGEDYLLVSTWKQDVSYYEKYKDSAHYNTGNYAIWVTAAPELRQRMKKEKYTDANLRLKQLLGLPPTSVYNAFVEFWVRPADLFRPCPDKEITDRTCDLCFPDNTDPAHIAWINTKRVERYYQCQLSSKYPWTQLGYTYDWNPENKSHVGLSEFIIGERKNIVVAGIYKTEDYLKK